MWLKFLVSQNVKVDFVQLQKNENIGLQSFFMFSQGEEALFVDVLHWAKRGGKCLFSFDGLLLFQFLSVKFYFIFMPV